MLKPTADLNVSGELWETKGRWKMETNLTDDLKVSLGTDDAVTFTDGAGIRQVSLPRTDSKGHLPFCYRDDYAENISPKFNFNRQYSLPFQDTFRQKQDDTDFTLPKLFEQNSSEDLSKPPTVLLSKAEAIIDSNSPTQMDIKWSVENAKLGANILFDVEIMTGTEWEFLTEKRIPVIRIYKTDQSVSLCKVKWDLNRGDTVWHVRVRPRDSDTTYDWSSSIKIEIHGAKMDTNFNHSDKTGSILY
ncbi:uncharacterized protein [Magallana gigas]|uniref:uncharacterized protein n=1 Tax=Magallana gigas TaxID=29159 RepID=UPI0033400BA8